MRRRIALALTIAAAASAGCRRTPLTASAAEDAGADRRADIATHGDAVPDIAEAGPETVRDSADGRADASDTSRAETGPDAPADLPRADAPADSGSERPADAPADRPAADAPPDTPTDAPTDRPNIDAPVDVSPADVPAQDRVSSDGTDVRPEDQPCGPLGFHCRPFACDVALGTCKTTCAGDGDCFTGQPCVRGSCGRPSPGAPCTSNAECNSSFCAQGVCCATACNGRCRSCAIPGAVGICTAVPAGGLDPTGTCTAGNVCDSRSECVPSVCAIDSECGRYHLCSNARCITCVATCASDADCIGGPVRCIDRNGCTRCDLPDAGVD
jgi:hypothetical protein